MGLRRVVVFCVAALGADVSFDGHTRSETFEISIGEAGTGCVVLAGGWDFTCKAEDPRGHHGGPPQVMRFAIDCRRMDHRESGIFSLHFFPPHLCGKLSYSAYSSMEQPPAGNPMQLTPGIFVNFTCVLLPLPDSWGESGGEPGAYLLPVLAQVVPNQEIARAKTIPVAFLSMDATADVDATSCERMLGRAFDWTLDLQALKLDAFGLESERDETHRTFYMAHWRSPAVERASTTPVYTSQVQDLPNRMSAVMFAASAQVFSPELLEVTSPSSPGQDLKKCVSLSVGPPPPHGSLEESTCDTTLIVLDNCLPRGTHGVNVTLGYSVEGSGGWEQRFDLPVHGPPTVLHEFFLRGSICILMLSLLLAAFVCRKQPTDSDAAQADRIDVQLRNLS